MRRVVACGLLVLLAPACAPEAVTYPVEEGPPRPAVCDERAVGKVCWEIARLASVEIGWRYVSEEEAPDDEPLGGLRVDPEGRLRYEVTVMARGEDVASVKEHYLFSLTGRIDDWRRSPATPPWDLRLVSRDKKPFETDYEILFDLTQRGRDVRIDAVVGTLLPARAIAGDKR